MLQTACPKTPPRIVLPYAEYKRLCGRVYTRDKWKCQVPCCRMRSQLHAHHIIYRSQGGDDASYNLITVCNNHHEDIHMGRLEILPFYGGKRINANQGVRWKVIDAV